jgi:hypothetical protein
MMAAVSFLLPNIQSTHIDFEAEATVIRIGGPNSSEITFEMREKHDQGCVPPKAIA